MWVWINMASVGSILSKDEGRDLDLALLLWTLVVTTVEGNEKVGNAFKAFNNIFFYFFNLLTS